MSHFSVAVLSASPDEVESLLEPFCEMPDNPDYLERCPVEETMDEIRAVYARQKDPGETLKHFASKYYGYTYDEELDECFYLCNSNAKWDWWMIGGRFENTLALKPGCAGYCSDNRYMVNGGRCDQALLRDVDLSMDQEAYDKAARFWEVVVEGDSVRENENPYDFDSYFKREYYLTQFRDKHTYAELDKLLSDFDFLNLNQGHRMPDSFVTPFINAGAYYTLKNRIMFEGKRIDDYNCEDSLKTLAKVARRLPNGAMNTFRVCC